MSNREQTVSDYELHAYVDGELDAQRRLEVEAWLAGNPEATARVRDYGEIRERLHARFDPVLAQPVTLPAGVQRGWTSSLARVAVLAVVAVLSGTLGWHLNNRPDPGGVSPALVELAQPAAFAHRVYATDTRYPVEIPAVEQASLNRWVSQRMHTELRAPDLGAQGLSLIGGRLLPSTDRMAAQFMYEDGQGARLTLYVRRIADYDGFSNFRYREQDGLHLFYWIDRAMGYAVVGEQPASRLIAVANAVHLAMQERKRVD
jgi:anti-sigma factor RsiW